MQNFRAYVISPAPLSEIHLRSGKILEKSEPRVVIEEEDPFDSPEVSPLRETIIPPTQASSLGLKSKIQAFQKPPFPERLTIEKPVIQPEFDILNELINVCVKIPLLQAIKDVPI